MARKLQTLFIECSAKTNVAVKDAFEELVTKVGRNKPVEYYCFSHMVQIIETPSLWQKQSSGDSNVRVSSGSNTFSSSGNDACSC